MPKTGHCSSFSRSSSHDPGIEAVALNWGRTYARNGDILESKRFEGHGGEARPHG